MKTEIHHLFLSHTLSKFPRSVHGSLQFVDEPVNIGRPRLAILSSLYQSILSNELKWRLLRVPLMSPYKPTTAQKLTSWAGVFSLAAGVQASW